MERFRFFYKNLKVLALEQLKKVLLLLYFRGVNLLLRKSYYCEKAITANYVNCELHILRITYTANYIYCELHLLRKTAKNIYC